MIRFACVVRRAVGMLARIATGGPLNELNERFGCNARKHTVAVMALLAAHPETATPRQLRALIERHAHAPACACGHTATGPIERFALRLWEAQAHPNAADWLVKHGRCSYAACLRFHHALFCEAPLRGRRFELKSQETLLEALRAVEAGWTARAATVDEDFGHAIDYMLEWCGMPQCGVQVKPHTTLARSNVVATNLQKNAQCATRVVWHVYNVDGAFESTDAIAHEILDARRTAEKRKRSDDPAG